MRDRPAQRILAGLLFLVLVAGAYVIDRSLDRTIATEVLFALILLLALWETFGLFQAKGRCPAVGLGMTAAVMLLFLKGSLGLSLLPTGGASRDLFVATGLVVALFATSTALAERERALDRIASTLAGFVYAAWIPSIALDLLHLPGASPGAARAAAYWVALVAKAADIGGYVAGRLLGRTKLLESVSPKKTVEGAVGGILLSVGSGIGLARLFALDSFSPAFAAIAGGAIGIAAQLGDLVESLIKRSAGAKDSSTRPTVFGGFLDLLDSLIVAFPAGYLLIQARGL